MKDHFGKKYGWSDSVESGRTYTKGVEASATHASRYARRFLSLDISAVNAAKVLILHTGVLMFVLVDSFAGHPLKSVRFRYRGSQTLTFVHFCTSGKKIHIFGL